MTTTADPPAVRTRRARTRLSAEARSAQLVDQGVQWLRERPLETITVEDLAAQAGVSPALVFYHFESRQGLLRTILAAAVERFVAAVAVDPGLPPRDRIRATLERMLAYARRADGTMEAMAQCASSHEPAVREVIGELRRLHLERFERGLSEQGYLATPGLRLCVRAWLVLVEQVLLGQTDPAGWVGAGTDQPARMDDDAVVDFLEHSLYSMADHAPQLVAAPA